jgi:hypothetical protein
MLATFFVPLAKLRSPPGHHRGGYRLRLGVFVDVLVVNESRPPCRSTSTAASEIKSSRDCLSISPGSSEILEAVLPLQML